MPLRERTCKSSIVSREFNLFFRLKKCRGSSRRHERRKASSPDQSARHSLVAQRRRHLKIDRSQKFGEYGMSFLWNLIWLCILKFLS